MSIAKTSRPVQLCEDTLATLSIASEMVQALYSNLQQTVVDQQAEIDQLRLQIRQLEEIIDGRDSSSVLEDAPVELSSGDTAELNGLTGIVRSTLASDKRSGPLG